jgi:RNA recognition motif-containing protein
MLSQLFFVNVPYNCSDSELREWIESNGIEIESTRIIRDTVSNASPAFAYAELKTPALIEEAVSALNGRKLRDQTILVKQASLQAYVTSKTAKITFGSFVQ